jgi:hypothetical protein
MKKMIIKENCKVYFARKYNRLLGYYVNIEEMKRIKALLFQATNEKDGSLIEKYLADKIKWHDGCDGENRSDIIFDWPKQDFINRNILNINGFYKRKIIIFQIAEGDKVCTFFTVEGIHDTGKIWDYSPTGKKIRYNAQYTARFENGLIVEIWATMDGHTLLRQLGIIN